MNNDPHKNILVAESLIARGYRRISNTHRIVARVDREDWRIFLARAQAPWNLSEGSDWVECLGNSAADYYRRCFSTDKKIIPTLVFKLIPSSNHDPIGYVPPTNKMRINMMSSKTMTVEPEDLRGKYKVHSINVVTGRSDSASNTFHDSLEAALTKGKSIVRNDCETQIVILRCTHVIQSAHPPVEVIDLDK